MKKVLAIFFSLALAAAILCSCGESNSNKTESKTSSAADNTEAIKAKSSTKGASPANMDAFEGSWTSVIDSTEKVIFDSATLKFNSGKFVMTMTAEELEEVSEGICEDGENGELICYCTKYTIRNTSDGTVEDEREISENEREDAKMTVKLLDNGQIEAVNYNGASIKFEKQ